MGQNVALPRGIVHVGKLPVESGISVAGIEPHSPADLAGVQVGDIIVGINDQLVSSIDDLHQLLTNQSVGHPYILVIIRQLEKTFVRIVPQLNQSS